MLASASVPVAFPPVFFDVVANGERYDELHVDGAVGANVFLSAGTFSISAVRRRRVELPAREEVYVIHNGQLQPRASQTRRSIVGIATRSFDGFARSSTIGDIFRIYAVTLRDDIGFQWITIPDSATVSGNEVFDPVIMGEALRARQEPLEGPRPVGAAPTRTRAVRRRLTLARSDANVPSVRYADARISRAKAKVMTSSDKPATDHPRSV